LRVRLADLKGRSVAVWGTDASALAALRAIAAVQPSRLLAVDDRADYAALPWDSTLAPLAGGDHAFPALVTADVIVGCVPGHPWLASIESRGITVTSGSALWMADHASRTVAVTGSKVAAAMIAHLLAAFDRPVVTGGPLLSLPAGSEYVVALTAAECARLTSSPRVAVVAALSPSAAPSSVEDSPSSAEDSPSSVEDQLNLLRHDPEMIVVNGADLTLRDAIRGVTDINRVPPIPAGAEDSRFRIEDDAIFCSDDALFPRATLRLPDADAGRDLCVALAVLDGLGVDVVGAKSELAAAVSAFESASDDEDV
jgi:UDP-N-acetylmuramoylalanine-D-glutamate ligase